MAFCRLFLQNNLFKCIYQKITVIVCGLELLEICSLGLFLRTKTIARIELSISIFWTRFDLT